MVLAVDTPDRYVSLLEEAGADYFLAVADGRHWFLDGDLVLALTGHKGVGESAALIDRNGHVFLVSSPAWDDQRGRTEAPGALTSCATDDPVSAILRLTDAERKPVSIATFGLDMASESFRHRLESATQVVPIDGAVAKMRRSKQPVEVERARRAARVAEESYIAALEQITPDTTEFEISARLDAEARRRGADDNFLLLSTGKKGRPVRLPSARRIGGGDTINLEISPSIDTQFAQICRTAIVGRASDMQRERYDLLVRAFDAGLAAARPGVSVSTLVEAVNGPVVGAGFAEYCRQPHMRTRGHGLGSSSLAPGSLTPDNQALLEPDMVFVLHPNQALPDSGYLLCGNPILITQDGAEPLIDAELRLDEIEV